MNTLSKVLLLVFASLLAGTSATVAAPLAPPAALDQGRGAVTPPPDDSEHKDDEAPCADSIGKHISTGYQDSGDPCDEP